MTKLIVDSTTDINHLITDNYDIEIIPLGISFDEKAYLDGVDIDIDTVYKNMRAGKVPKTSQVSFESVTQAFDKCISSNDDFIYLAFSSKMSGTYNFAKLILDDYKEKYPERKMAIIDSKGGCGGAGLIAIQALRMIESKLPFETIVNQIHFMIEHMVYYFTLADLRWLTKGGRVTGPLGQIGNMLNIKPYLTVKDGMIVLSKVIRGSKKLYNTLISSVQTGTAKFKNQLIGISHSDDLAAALDIEERVKEVVEGCKTTIFQIGAALSSHLGIGGVRVFFLDEKPKHYELI